MPKTRGNIARSLLKGLLVAAAFTFAAMLLIAAALIFFGINDSLLSILNQITKLAAVLLGACAAVPRGGTRGFAVGACVALFYACLGFALYALLGGGGLSFSSMSGEILICAAVGAVTGAVRANLRPRARRSKSR